MFLPLWGEELEGYHVTIFVRISRQKSLKGDEVNEKCEGTLRDAY